MAEAIAPNATIYIRNLDEKIKIPVLVTALQTMFGEVGTVVDVIAKKSIKRKGQAFVVFESTEEAEMALDTLQGFDFLGRPLELAYAKTRSDAIVVREDGPEALEEHKKQRLAEKERKQALEAQEAAAKSAKRAAEPSLAERPAKSAKPSGGALVDEYNAPNKTLLVRDLPESYTKELVSAVFQRFPGFKEVRMVESRPGIAFVDYSDESESAVAREKMNGITLGEKTIRVTFQRSG